MYLVVYVSGVTVTVTARLSPALLLLRLAPSLRLQQGPLHIVVHRLQYEYDVTRVILSYTTVASTVDPSYSSVEWSIAIVHVAFISF